MEQQQFGIKLSLSTKLLTSIVVLIVVAIGGISASSIVILGRDKKAYTYQMQSKEAVLAGREFSSLVQQTTSTLRLVLSSIGLGMTQVTEIESRLRRVIENQDLIKSVDYALLDGSELKFIGSFSIDEQRFELSTDQKIRAVSELRELGFAFVNVSSAGAGRAIAVMIVDQSIRDRAAPVAVGYIRLEGWGTEFVSPGVTLTDRKGWVLYDGDSLQSLRKGNVGIDPLFAAAASSTANSGAIEFDSEEGRHFVGSYYRAGLGLNVLNRNEWGKVMSSAYAITEKFILIGVLGIGVAVVFSIVFAHSLSSPLLALYDATREVSRGNFKLDLSVKTQDEIGALTRSFQMMASKILGLIDERLKQAHLENELAIASTVQQTLIPVESFSDECFRIESYYRSAAECGGDWWSFFGVGNRICVMISDATGHGLPSALITAAARSCFSVISKIAQEDVDFSFSPAAMLNYANRVVYESARGKIMMTFFIGFIDLDQMKLTYSSAGHNPPWLFRKDSDGSYKLKSLTAKGQRLGEYRENEQFEEHTVDVGVGDQLFLYTDGITEGKNEQGEMFGKKRVRRAVEQGLPQGPRAVLDILVEEFLAHNGAKQFDDDVSLAVLELLREAIPGRSDFIEPPTSQVDVGTYGQEEHV